MLSVFWLFCLLKWLLDASQLCRMSLICKRFSLFTWTYCIVCVMYHSISSMCAWRHFATYHDRFSVINRLQFRRAAFDTSRSIHENSIVGLEHSLMHPLDASCTVWRLHARTADPGQYSCSMLYMNCIRSLMWLRLFYRRIIQENSILCTDSNRNVNNKGERNC